MGRATAGQSHSRAESQWCTIGQRHNRAERHSRAEPQQGRVTMVHKWAEAQ